MTFRIEKEDERATTIALGRIVIGLLEDMIARDQAAAAALFRRLSRRHPGDDILRTVLLEGLGEIPPGP